MSDTQTPAEFGRDLAREFWPDGEPRGDVQGVIGARFGLYPSPGFADTEEALKAYDAEFKRLCEEVGT